MFPHHRRFVPSHSREEGRIDRMTRKTDAKVMIFLHSAKIFYEFLINNEHIRVIKPKM